MKEKTNWIAMYNISEGTTATKGNELGIYEDLGDIYAQEDLDLFFSNLARYVLIRWKVCLEI